MEPNLSTAGRSRAALSTGPGRSCQALKPARHDDLMSAELPSQGQELLVIQGKAIARRQSAGSGIDARTMRGRVDSGRWQRLQRGVYAAYSGEPARETVLWTALLRAGPDATLSHQTAAERHGLTDEPSSPITITVPASRHPTQSKIPGIVIHRSDAILRTRHPTMLPRRHRSASSRQAVAR